MTDELKNQAFTSYDPRPAPACANCGQKLSIALTMLNSHSGNTVRMFKCKCGERTWTEEK